MDYWRRNEHGTHGHMEMAHLREAPRFWSIEKQHLPPSNLMALLLRPLGDLTVGISPFPESLTQGMATGGEP